MEKYNEIREAILTAHSIIPKLQDMRSVLQYIETDIICDMNDLVLVNLTYRNANKPLVEYNRELRYKVISSIMSGLSLDNTQTASLILKDKIDAINDIRYRLINMHTIMTGVTYNEFQPLESVPIEIRDIEMTPQKAIAHNLGRLEEMLIQSLVTTFNIPCILKSHHELAKYPVNDSGSDNHTPPDTDIIGIFVSFQRKLYRMFNEEHIADFMNYYTCKTNIANLLGTKIEASCEI